MSSTGCETCSGNQSATALLLPAARSTNQGDYEPGGQTQTTSAARPSQPKFARDTSPSKTVLTIYRDARIVASRVGGPGFIHHDEDTSKALILKHLRHTDPKKSRS